MNQVISRGSVLSVSKRSHHQIDKLPCDSIRLVAGHGVEGDAHAGLTVKHRSRVARDPDQPNLRQVHLIHAELFDELQAVGFHLTPGQMGENITTQGIDLLALPQNTRLAVGAHAIIRVTGLRNPCNQLNGLQEGLMQALVFVDHTGQVIRKAGIMCVVEVGGPVTPGDPIHVLLPVGNQIPLAPV